MKYAVTSLNLPYCIPLAHSYYFPFFSKSLCFLQYLCELSLMQGDPYLSYLPSEIAAAALCVSRASLLPDEDVLPPQLHAVLDVQLADIIHVIGALEATYRAAESNAQQATRDKFKTDKYVFYFYITFRYSERSEERNVACFGHC